MDAETIRALLDDVRGGRLDVEEAVVRLRGLPYADLGFAKLDLHRALRGGAPEAVFCPGKTPEQVVARWMRSRIVDEGLAVQLVAVFLVSIAIGAAVVIVGGVWSGVSEIVRVGNEHLSFRASRIGWPRRAPVWFLATMAGFWAFAAVGLLRRRPASGRKPRMGFRVPGSGPCERVLLITSLTN